jgi:hypothetical protein
MGIAYRVVAALQLSVVVIDGDVTRDDFYGFARAQEADPEWHTTTRSLTDARTAIIPEVTADQISDFADLYTKMRADDSRFRSAIIPGSNFAIAGNYAELRSDGHTHTVAFNDLITACIWLAVDSDVIRATTDDLRGELRRTDKPS